MPTPPQRRWKSPVFIDADGGLVVCESLQEAEVYLEPEDIHEPTTVYDAMGKVWSRSIAGSRVKLLPAAEPSRPNALVEILRDHLERLHTAGTCRRDSQWI